MKPINCISHVTVKKNYFVFIVLISYTYIFYYYILDSTINNELNIDFFNIIVVCSVYTVHHVFVHNLI